MNSPWILVASHLLVGLLFFFVAANNPDKAVKAKWWGGKLLNTVRRVIAKIKAAVLDRKKKK